MEFLIWTLPTLVVAGAIGSGRLSVTVASILGLLTAIPVALLTGTAAFGVHELIHSLARGAWIGSLIAPYILGGLLFWQVASGGSSVGRSHSETAGNSYPSRSPVERRRLLFFACFLVGPFAESATGFGAGMLGTVTLIQGMGFAPRHLMLFALLSQTVIPWGAMASGTLLAAAYVRISPATLGLYAVAPVALLTSIWLPLFWRTARDAGAYSSMSEHVREVCWIAVAMLLLATMTAVAGPESALLGAYGVLIVIFYLLTFHPNLRQFLATARKALPYVILVGGLAAARLVPGLRHVLTSTSRVAPFEGLPAFSPLLHAGIWFMAGALVTAMTYRQVSHLKREASIAWRTGKQALLTVFFFAMMAEVLTGAGIAGEFASSLFSVLKEKTVLITPLLSGAFGILTNSGNAPNSLFLPSLNALAIQAGLSVPAVAAVQHVSGMSLGFFSPVRMSIAARLAKGEGLERSTYVFLLPYAIVGFSLMIIMALCVIWKW
ncbi:hypothetical protein ACS7SF_23895 (plasmid) [Ralstonia sp. 25C]|uniref:hypothetical protein n=1 Tax=Ralstonia sp. 25C TaxID=3447363 RepID=UPI003F74EC55